MTIYLTPPAGGGGVANVASGTTTVEGTVRLATTVEAQDVNNETLAVTPKGLNAQIASAIAGGVTYEGTIAGDNIPTLTTATKGQLYKIDTASSGVVAGFNWSINDNLLINADMGGTFDANKINKIDSTDSDLATVASTGSYNDLSDKPSIPSASTDLTDTASLVRTTDLATVATSGSYNDLLNQPTIPSASTDLTDTATLVRTTDLATVATTGSYADLLNQPTIPSSSDDLTSDHDPTNYTGALNGSLTTHLAGIDTALGNALSGTTDSILEGQAKVETIDTGSDARIEFSADPNGTGTEKIWEFNSSGHLIPNVNDTYDIGSAEKKVRDLYLGSSTLYMGGTLSLGVVDGNLRLSGGGNLEVGASTVLTDATLPSIPESSADLSDGADLLKTGDKGVAIGDIVEVIDVGGSVAGISALDGSNLTNLTYANITGTPTLATVATSGESTDLTDTATLVRTTDLASTTSAGIVELATIAEAGGTSETLAVTPAGLQAELAGVVSGTQYQGAVAYDAISTDLVNASVGDMYRLSSSGSAHGYDWTIGDLIIVNADMGGTFDANKINRFDTTDADLATVATTGDYNDLINTPSSGVPVATFNTTQNVDATVNTAYYAFNTSANNATFTLPNVSGLSNGDVIIITRQNAGNIIIRGFDYNAGTPTQLIDNFGSVSSTHTITCNNQQIYIRYASGNSRWFIFDKSQALVATSGDYNDLSNVPTDSDDFTANLNPTNYLNVNNTDTITAHLSAIDTALGNVSGGSSYTFSAISSATTAQIEYHYSCDTSGGAFTLTLPDITSVTAGQEIRIKLATAGNDLTIAPHASGQTIDGDPNHVLSVVKSAITLVANNANSATDWEII